MRTYASVVLSVVVIAGCSGDPNERGFAEEGEGGGTTAAALGVDADSAEPTVGRDVNREIVAALERNPAMFSGVSIDETRNVLTVRYARSAGAAAASAPELATARTLASQRGLQLELVQVEDSLEELEAVRREVASNSDWRRIAGAVMSEWYVDITRNVVAVGVTQLTPELEAAARGLFGDRVSLHTAGWMQRTSRENDARPFDAGILLSDGYSMCTAGFVIRYPVAAPYIYYRMMVTAGHCFGDGRVVGNWNQDLGTFQSHFTNYELDYGYVGIDLGQNLYSPSTYINSSTSSPEDKWPIQGGRSPIVGEHYCTNGAYSLKYCGAGGAIVEATDVCASSGLFGSGGTTCHLARMRFADGINPTRGGDSGGNVYSWEVGQYYMRLHIGGIIIGRSGANVYFHPYYRLIQNGWELDTAP